MIAIGDIATLCARADSMEREDLKVEAMDLNWRIIEGMASLETNHSSTVFGPEPESISNSMTHVFAAAALVQLYALTTDYAISPYSIHVAVDETISVIRRVPRHLSRRGLSWPLCIAGSLANADQ
ncbi:hypothetical protein CFD26_101894 [Aspergillus turcosus]|uniref:Transcription factor domain-containing protein n=1 Tax=Aspergillus turcosus TaxID=1245748 RepID=A0A3R7F9M4_9EURO|nr:hypothetical protein CFD26_101894 [Aspergillus turcosus]